MEPLVVIAIKQGAITEVYSTDANQKIIIVNLDLEENREKTVTWPDTQYDDDRVEELLNLKR